MKLEDTMPMQLPQIFPDEEEIAQQVYDTLMGQLIRECCLPWVADIFVPGQPCFEAYTRMHEAYSHLRVRLGIEGEDEDVETIIDALLEYGRVSAMKMFEYGRIYQRMQQ